MTSIGFVIENLSYNGSIVTYRDSNINSPKDFCSIKLLSIKKQFIYECCANTLLLRAVTLRYLPTQVGTKYLADGE